MKKMIISGNVGGNPELRTDSAGNQFVAFAVAVSVGTKQKPKTDWINISANGKLAEISRRYIKKGVKVLIEGFPTVTVYVNRESQAVAIQNLYPLNIEILSGRNEELAKDIGYHQFYEKSLDSPLESAPISENIAAQY